MLIRHAVEPQFVPPVVVSFTTTVMVELGKTVMLAAPFNVTELIVSAAWACPANPRVPSNSKHIAG
ncbi:MAG: hypothetical protein WA435_04565 [Gallionellaceae bacterium]